MTKFIYKPVTNSTNFGGRRSKNNIKFIVIHWTANTSKGAGANNHYLYVQNHNNVGSAHYYVDDNEIIQIIGDTTTAWSVEGRGYKNGQNGCWNSNSISIEMCVNNGYSDKMLFNTVELVKELLRQYPNARVCRHWDCNKKDCPSGWTGGNNARWNWFLSEIKKNRKMILDLSKSSEGKLIGNNNLDKPSENANFVKSGKTKVKNEGRYSVITNTPNDVLNVRELPSANSKLVWSYNHTSKIYVISVWKGQGETWYEIQYDKGKFGYVSARYCKGIK